MRTPKTVYLTFREGQPIGGSYLYDHYKRGRLETMKPSKDATLAMAAWDAGRDAALNNEPNPYEAIG